MNLKYMEIVFTVYILLHRMLGSVKVSDIAPLVYQLLLLATKVQYASMVAPPIIMCCRDTKYWYSLE